MQGKLLFKILFYIGKVTISFTMHIAEYNMYRLKIINFTYQLF